MPKTTLIRVLLGAASILLLTLALLPFPFLPAAPVLPGKAYTTEGFPHTASNASSAWGYRKAALRFGAGRRQDRAFVRKSMGTSVNTGGARTPASVLPPPAGDFTISYVNLNGRGASGMFVRYAGPRSCAEGECNIELFIAQPGGAWKSVLSETAAGIRVLPHKTRGYRDVLFRKQVYGIVEQTIYQWNGHQYALASDRLGSGPSYLR